MRSQAEEHTEVASNSQAALQLGRQLARRLVEGSLGKTKPPPVEITRLQGQDELDAPQDPESATGSQHDHSGEAGAE